MTNINESSVLGICLLIQRFIQQKNAKVSFQTIYEIVIQFSLYNDFSMLHIQKLFNELGFQTFAAKVRPELLCELSYPVFSHRLENEYRDFILIENFKNGELRYYLPGARSAVTEKVKNFIEKYSWEGNVLLVNSDSPIFEDSYDQKNQIEIERSNDYLRNHLLVKDNFLTNQECDYLVNFSTKKFNRSLVHSEGTTNMVSARRTSYSAFLTDLDSTFKKNLIKKSIELLDNRAYTEFENIQCVFYKKDQEFRPHFDSGEKVKRRYSLLVYLNEIFTGGETYFPLLNFTVTPKKGRVVMFSNLNKDNTLNLYSYHSGLPVISGKKIACNIWIQ